MRLIIGDRLRDLRERRNMTQSYVAETMSAVGYAWTQQTVSQIEAGRRSLAAEELCILAAVFGIDATDLLPRAS